VRLGADRDLLEKKNLTKAGEKSEDTRGKEALKQQHSKRGRFAHKGDETGD